MTQPLAEATTPGFLISLSTLTGVLERLSDDSKRWWISPQWQRGRNASSVLIGYQDRCSTDLTNDLYFTFKIVSVDVTVPRTEGAFLYVNPDNLNPIIVGLYRFDGGLKEDFLEDFNRFYVPLREILAVEAELLNSSIIVTTDSSDQAICSREGQEHPYWVVTGKGRSAAYHPRKNNARCYLWG